MSKHPSYRFSVAPMMDWTDRHCRFFHRLLSKRALLYTEMVTADAIIHGDRERLLGFDPAEHPLALQLGGSDPEKLARAAAVGAVFGYDEINLNVGCPSDRVRSGRFGACLMAEPARVADCIAAMRGAVSPTLPVTVKCRIGIDDLDSYEHLAGFTEQVAGAGSARLIVHARKAWLSGLSPKQNREIPPLRYDVVFRLKRDFPELPIVLNGGIADLQQALALLTEVDGVMLGRAAYQTPALLTEVDRRVYRETTARPARPADAVRRLTPYLEQQLVSGVRLNAITRHVLGLFQGRPGARAWRRYLSEHAHRPGAGGDVLLQALRFVDPPGRQAAAGNADQLPRSRFSNTSPFSRFSAS